jgi:hypothetical protein
MVIKWKGQRGGKWVPEDRLRATLWGAALFVPVSVLLFGFVTQYVEGKVGLVVNLVCLFVNGFGVRRCTITYRRTWFPDAYGQVDIVLSPSATYFVDAVHDRSAEMMAANK